MSRLENIALWVSGTDVVLALTQYPAGTTVNLSALGLGPAVSTAATIVPALTSQLTCDRGQLRLDKATVFPGGGSAGVRRTTTTDALFYAGESFLVSNALAGADTEALGNVPASFTAAGTRVYAGAETMEVTAGTAGSTLSVTRRVHAHRQDHVDSTLPKPSGMVCSNRVTFPRCGAILLRTAGAWTVLDVVVLTGVTTSRTTHNLTFRSFEAILDRPMAVGFTEQGFRVNGTGRGDSDHGAVNLDPEGPDATDLFGGTSADDSADLYVDGVVLRARTDYAGARRFQRGELEHLGYPVVSDITARTVKQTIGNVALFSALGDGANGTLDVLPCSADGNFRCGAAIHEDTITDPVLLDLLAAHTITLGAHGQESILPWLASLCALEGRILRASAGELSAQPFPGTQHTINTYTLASGDDISIRASVTWQRNSVKVEHANGTARFGHPSDSGETSIRFPHHAVNAPPPAVGYRPFQAVDVLPAAARMRLQSVIRKTHVLAVPVLDVLDVFAGDTLVLPEGTVLVLGLILDFAKGTARVECATDRSYRRWHWSAYASGSGTSATVPLDSASGTVPVPADFYTVDAAGTVSGPYGSVSASGTTSVTLDTPITYTGLMLYAEEDDAYADYGVDSWL